MHRRLCLKSTAMAPVTSRTNCKPDNVKSESTLQIATGRAVPKVVPGDGGVSDNVGAWGRVDPRPLLNHRAYFLLENAWGSTSDVKQAELLERLSQDDWNCFFSLFSACLFLFVAFFLNARPTPILVFKWKKVWHFCRKQKVCLT